MNHWSKGEPEVSDPDGMTCVIYVTLKCRINPRYLVSSWSVSLFIYFYREYVMVGDEVHGLTKIQGMRRVRMIRESCTLPTKPPYSLLRVVGRVPEAVSRKRCWAFALQHVFVPPR